MSRYLVTGGCGFIGSHVVERLLERGDAVRVLDNFDPFYDRRTKEANLAQAFARSEACAGDFAFVEGDLREPTAVARATEGCDGIVHLAALAGVRPSIERPVDYWDVNLTGTQCLLNAALDRAKVEGRKLRFVFGSSSSVYGGNDKVPFHEDDPVLAPVSPYAATKRSGELQCSTFHHLTGVPVSCLRFFTVFGPRQRPEMAIHKFTRMIEDGQEIPMFGDGSSSRDYTFVSDIVDGVLAALDRCGNGQHPGFRIYNLGGAATTTLRELIDTIGKALGKEPRVQQLPDQPGDVPRTFADVSRAAAELDYSPKVPVAEGIPRFVEWYRDARQKGEIA